VGARDGVGIDGDAGAGEAVGEEVAIGQDEDAAGVEEDRASAGQPARVIAPASRAS
jgi:hypothetical protein